MRSRTVVGAAASLCLLLGAAACGGDDEDSEADLVEELSQTLQGDGDLDQATADCFAQVVVDEVGVEELQDVDLSAAEPPPELQEAIAAAAVSATEECELSEPE
jgi:hypothetical protein